MVGGSGTGKSVLMRSIIGLQTPDEGEIEVFGEPMIGRDEEEAKHVRRRWGVLFQGGALVLDADRRREHPGADQGILSRASTRSCSTRSPPTRSTMSGLATDAGAKFPSELSGGMRKRAGIARALALDPELLFLDEPTAGLDPIGAAAFDQLILELRDALGLTVFLITHDLDTLYAICDRVAVLADRKVVAVGTIPELLALDHEWIQDYFKGPRGRAAASIAETGRGQRLMETRSNQVLVGSITLGLIAALVAVHRLAEPGRRRRREDLRHLLPAVGRRPGQGLGGHLLGRAGRPDRIDQPGARQPAIHPGPDQGATRTRRCSKARPRPSAASASPASRRSSSTRRRRPSPASRARPRREIACPEQNPESECPYGVPVIPTKPGALGQLLNTAPELLERVSTLTERLTELLSDRNQESIAGILDNLEEVSRIAGRARARDRRHAGRGAGRDPPGRRSPPTGSASSPAPPTPCSTRTAGR